MVAYLGPQSNPYTGESYELTQAHFDELRSLAVARPSMPDRYFLLVQAGDELRIGAVRQSDPHSDGFRILGFGVRHPHTPARRVTRAHTYATAHGFVTRALLRVQYFCDTRA
ncbi:MAG: YqiA/YcfP family alpha/beta fold hydrolase [Burkholderiales bacterium]